MLPFGIYEEIVNQMLDEKLQKLDPRAIFIDKAGMEPAEAHILLGRYMGNVIQRVLAGSKDHGRGLSEQVQLCNELLNLLDKRSGVLNISDYFVDNRAELLLSLLDKRNTAWAVTTKQNYIRPTVSIAQSSLFTGAALEPQMYDELKREIISSDSIDFLVSFIKWSGLRLLMDELSEFTKTRYLRIITTSYMGASDIKAIEELRKLPNTEIKISYDTKHTRLHAKTYIFYRATGFSTAYVGSSNLSNAAISGGLEWNVKITEKDLAPTMQKIQGTFASYWNSGEFKRYTEADKPILVKALNAEKYRDFSDGTFYFDIKPYGYQQEILDKLYAERIIRGRFRNLIVAATGTGKTVISAFDYKRFCLEHPQQPNRLLFIAHREEILKQSLTCFRNVLRNNNFGELFVGGHEADNLDHLFISIQTLNSRKLIAATDPEYYDYIIVDEFHHAAADSYQPMLSYYQPKILLGLTATPERMDEQDVLKYFDNHIAAEIRLPEAINRHLLCPFQYFGVTDNVDLHKLRWCRGYDKRELSNVYTGNDLRAAQIIRSLNKYMADMGEIKGLAFCVSVEHAKYMANYFNQQGVPALALCADSAHNIRDDAKIALSSGTIKFIFVVDLYNEGVDIPEVNTILFLRPTESLTVFLQQLGRGLRRFNGKECLTVLDFIGQCHKRYNFQEKLAALLMRNGRRTIRQELAEGFSTLPRGCYIQLEKQAQQYIMDNIRAALGTRGRLVEKLKAYVEEYGRVPSLAEYLAYGQIGLKEIYPKLSYSRLCVIAQVRADFFEDNEETIAKLISRLRQVNSRRWLVYLLDILPRAEDIIEQELNGTQNMMLLMLHYTAWQKIFLTCGFDGIKESILKFKQNPVMFAELIEVLKYLYNKIDFIDEKVYIGFACPLDLHCNYSRDQILTGLGYYTGDRKPPMQSGVQYFPEKNLDVFFITINKSEKDYSPNTMYEDYSIDAQHFHWQSQHATAEDSKTGRRYINHRQTGSKVVLFVREYKQDESGVSPYTFFGLAEYVSHTGSKPMSIIWRLKRPIPSSLLRKTNKLIIS